jgi:hypothetical protein
MSVRPPSLFPFVLGLTLVSAATLVLLDRISWVSIRSGGVLGLSLVVGGVLLLLSTIVGRWIERRSARGATAPPARGEDPGEALRP